MVVVHPKAYVNTTATTWASNTICLCWELSDLFESEDSNYSKEFRGLCARLKAVCKYYIDTTTETDMDTVTSSPECRHRAYEKLRLSKLKSSLEKITELCRRFNSLRQRTSLSKKLIHALAAGPEEAAKELGQSILSAMDAELKHSIRLLCSSFKTILELIESFQLPCLYRYVVELTDAGPGVGVSHAEVRLRVLEVARLLGWEKVLRLHRAREDSGQNEAERLNACVGDAFCDGGSLHWQKHKTYEGLTEDDLETMSLDDLNAHNEIITEKNAWAVANKVCLRIDDSPAPRGYTSALVVEHCSDFLLFNMEFMRQYLDAAESKKSSVP